MTKQRAAYVAYVVEEPKPSPSPIPRDLFNFWRRVAKLTRGRVYNVLVIVPEQHDQPVKWTFLGDGKIENEG